MKVDFDFIDELLDIKEQIKTLSEKREKIVSDNTKSILKKVYNMMDWRETDIEYSKVKYSTFEKRIMIEITLKKDSCARYVFELNAKELHLRFREDFSRCPF